MGQNFFVVFCLSLAAVAVITAAVVRGVTAFVAVAVALLLLFLVALLFASAFQYVGLQLAHV